MSEPTIICPNCKTEIKLTESLAAPLIESTRRDYEKRLALKDVDVAKKEESLREREAAVSQASQSIDDQVAEKLALERAKIAAEESKKAKFAAQTDIDQKTRELAELQDVLSGSCWQASIDARFAVVAGSPPRAQGRQGAVGAAGKDVVVPTAGGDDHLGVAEAAGRDRGIT